MEHVRVAQNVNVGTANVAATNEGLDTYGWTDTYPTQFDMGITAHGEAELGKGRALARPIRTQTLPDGTVQYGRLQLGVVNGEMDIIGYNYESAAAVVVNVNERAFNWNKEEFDALLQHELRHCEHRTASKNPASVWKRLRDKGFDDFFSLFTEMIAYFDVLQNRNVSFKFLIEYGCFQSFIMYYNKAKKALKNLKDPILNRNAKALIQTCYNDVQFSELRAPESAGWKYHIDPP